MKRKCRKNRKKKKQEVVKPAETEANFEEEISPPRKNTLFMGEPEEEH